MPTDDDEYQFKLAKYLLNYDPTATNAPNAFAKELKIDPRLLTDDQLLVELNENLHRVRPFARPGLAGFHSFQQQQVSKRNERDEKYELLEHHHVYDTDLLTSLKEFIIITICLLVKLERMHKKHILCGNINPYTFLYSKKRKHCEPVDLGVVLSDKNVVKAEKQAYGPYIYLLSDLGAIPYNRYLAPELRESVLAYDLQKRLKDVGDEAKRRNLAPDQCREIDLLLHDFHQKKIRYTNRAEIYSVGYTINQILSHTLSKLAHTGLRMNEFPSEPFSKEVIHEAELLLPDSFANPEEERVFALVNEAVEYTHDLMHEHMELRDSLELSIEKFSSLLKRSSITKPDDILGEEEEEALEEELAMLLAEEEHEGHHAHAHEEHEEHLHDDHGHDDHGHDHGHYDHPHEDHDDHGHGDHDDHGHGDHDDHGHGDHDEHGHGDHDDHGHGDHDDHGHSDHDDHGHGDHDDHGHGDHDDHGHGDHGDHDHGDHDHDDHDHGDHDHDDHGHGDHDDHGADHDDHGHDDSHGEGHDNSHDAGHEGGHDESHASHDGDHANHDAAHAAEHGDHKDEHDDPAAEGGEKILGDDDPDPRHSALRRPGAKH